MAFHLGNRARLILRTVGIAVLALIMFVFALQLTFPYDRVKDKAIDALSSSYDVTIGSVERGWVPGRVYFKAVTLRTRPKPDESVTTFYIEKLEVDLGLLALIGMNLSVNLDAKIGPGRIKGNITLPKFGRAGVKIDVEGTDLPGASLPLRAAVGLPITGKLQFAVALEVPNVKTKMGRTITDWTKADGHIDISCPSGCTIGDGKTKLKPLLKNRSQQVMIADGIDFGKVNLDSLVAKAVFTPAVGNPDQHSSTYKPGRLEVTKFEVKSPDGELHVEYAMTLAQDFGESIVAGCLRFKGNDSLLKHEETKKTYAAIQTTGAELRSDGLFHIKLTDRFKDMKRLNMECGPNVKINNGEDFSAGPHVTRPNLTVQPEEGVRTGIGNMQPPPIQAQQPPPPPPPVPADAATPTAAPARIEDGVPAAGSGAEPNPSAPPPGASPTGVAPSRER